MKMFLSVLFIASLVLAEPPVGDGYAAARSSHNNQHHDHDHDHHTSDHQRSLSQEYGPPSENFASARNAPSDGYEYNAPNTRSSLNARGQSRFPPATVRVSFNQRFSSAAARNSNNNARSRPQDLSAPNTRSGISQEYGAPASRSLSQEYGAPSVVSARTLSTEYGMPDARSTPSQEYGAPVVAARSNQKPHSANFRSAQSSKSLTHDHSSPASRSQFHTDAESHSFSATSASSNDLSEGYQAPKSTIGSRTAPSTSYGAPSSRSSTSYGISSARNSDSEVVNSVSQTYGAPNQRNIQETYEAPNTRGLSQEYGVPSSRTNLMTSAVPSSIASPRSSPSSSYLPASRNAAPSEQYGVPEHDNAGQGYEDARARALEELENQVKEPASYDFGYQIEDQESGSDFGHSETREAGKAQGSYFVVRPDGTKQTVEYEADERGFKPRISVEAAGASGRSGYDENAQDLARSAGGPY